jgi:hypothetical protein
MTDDALVSALARASGTGLAGLAFGLLYFAALRRTADLCSNKRSRIGAAALTVCRLAGAVVLFALAARLGAGALLAAFLGFLLARTIALRSVGRAG